MTALIGPTVAADRRSGPRVAMRRHTAAEWRTRTARIHLSVVVCCHTERRWDDLLAAVESVRAQSLPPKEILVVVDECEALLQRLRDRWTNVSVMANAYRRGLSGARNTGVECSTGDVVVFLDDDAVADSDWLSRIAGEYADPEVAGVGGRADPGWATAPPRWFPDEFAWTVGASYRGMPLQRDVVRNVFGCNMSFRRDVLLAIGGFREGLGRTRGRPMGCEETELCIRASAVTGGSIVYQPDAVVTHRVSADREQFAYFRARCYAEGLSKALVAEESSSEQALRTERSYVARVLPAGVLRGLGEGLSGHLPGFGRAGAILTGLGVTAWGYGVGRAVPRLRLAEQAVRAQWTSVLPMLAALVLWGVSLGRTDVSRMDDFGLISVLPIPFWCALAVLVAAYPALLLRKATPTPVLALHLASFLLVVHATPAVLYGSPRYSWTWKHLGIIDYVVRHGAVDTGVPYLSAYHAWPGFFTLNAFLAEVGGVEPRAYASWAPPFFEVLFLIPLAVLFRTLTRDRRRVWAALGLFAVGNWVGQDYFAPQALAYFLYLSILALGLRYLPLRPHQQEAGALPRALRRFRMRARFRIRVARSFYRVPVPHVPRFAHGWWARRAAGALPRAPVTGGRRTALLILIVLLIVALAPTHQLTPLMLITALSALVLLRCLRPWWLPLVAGIAALGWMVLAARPFLEDNALRIAESVGQLTNNATTTFVPLGDVPEAQHVVDWADRSLSAALWLMAAAGVVIALRRGRLELVPLALMLSPLPLLVSNDYGGEMLFRVYLFSMPFVAFLAAGLLPSRVQPTAVRRGLLAAVAACLALVLTGAFLLAYYGKERSTYFSPSVVAASDWLFTHARAGSVIAGATSNFPWAFTRHEDFSYVWFQDFDEKDRRALDVDPAAVVLDEVEGRAPGMDAYVILTSSQKVQVQYTGTLSASTWDHLMSGVRSSPRFQVAFENADAVVFRVVPERPREPVSGPHGPGDIPVPRPLAAPPSHSRPTAPVPGTRSPSSEGER